MLKIIFFLLGLIGVLSTPISAVAAMQIPDSIPKPKFISLQDSMISVGQISNINIDKKIKNKFKFSIQNFINILNSNNGGVPIEFVVYDINNSSVFSSEYQVILSHSEGYLINITNTKILIIGSDDLGLLHGMTTLQEIIAVNHGKLSSGIIWDYPDIHIRAMHFAIHPGTTIKDIKNFILRAKKSHFNTLIIMIEDGIKFKSMNKISRKDALSVQELEEILKFANENGMEVIPEIKLLTHQQWFFKETYPDLMLNKYTYNPDNSKVYSTIFPMIDEMINIMHPKFIHIGHDEVVGFGYKLSYKPPSTLLTPQAFLRDVNVLHEYLHRRNITVLMWGDMLLAPEEFPIMDKNILNGVNGYSVLRTQIPKDIIICDWHYFDQQQEFPSTQELVSKGYQVYGATWGETDHGRNGFNTIKNFSNYILTLNQKETGMIATTWYPIWNKDKENLINNIIKSSGEAFWNAK